MGADLILAMILAAVITRAWEQSKRRSAAAWAQAQQRAQQRQADRERARRARTQARARRYRAARAKGPRDPLWWAYAAGWIAAGAVRAGYAGIQGAREGAAAGAREGHRLGREAAHRGWGYRQSWAEYRHRRARASADTIGGEPGDAGHEDSETVMELCPACGIYTSAARLVDDPEAGRVCPACVGRRDAGREQRPTGGNARHLGYADLDPDTTAWGVATVDDDGGVRVAAHSDMAAAEHAAQGRPWITVAGASGRPTTTPPEVYYHPQQGWTLAGIGVPLPERAERADSVTDPAVPWQRVRVVWPDGGDYYDEIRGWDREDALRNARRNWIAETPHERAEHIEYLGPADPPELSVPDDAARGCDCGGAMVPEGEVHSLDEGDGTASIDLRCPECGVQSWHTWELADAEYEAQFGHAFDDQVGSDDPDYDPPDPDDGIGALPTGGNSTMTALPAGDTAGTGEGYTDTVATLTTLARQLAAAHQTAQTLIDNLTAAEVDNETITNLGELVDMLDTSSPLAERTARHVQQRHEPIAEAVAEAGGSGNVATKSWYDDH